MNLNLFINLWYVLMYCDWRDYQEEDIIGEEFKLFLLNQTNKFSISPLSNPPNQIQIGEN